MLNRYLITGLLTAKTPLHIGSGETISRSGLEKTKYREGEEKLIEISAIATDFRQRAYLPGTAIKGNMRAWLTGNGINPDIIETLFGSADTDSDDALGGKAEFHDAFYDGPDKPDVHVPYWDNQRLTGVTASVALNRLTRTAVNSKLFHEEFVPPGISFKLEISGKDFTDDELSLLLFCLEGFNHADKPVEIGASTGNDYGSFVWKLTRVARLLREDVDSWLSQNEAGAGYCGLVQLKQDIIESIKAKALQQFHVNLTAAVKIGLTVSFDGPFLVNGPGSTKKKGNKAEHDAGLPDFIPLKDSLGRLLLPARSLRGAFRSQAEKILRTLNPLSACLENNSCKPVYNEKETEKLCLACRLFGASGWRSPVEFSDFIALPESGGESFHQEFTAIDRFTGGVAGSAKFNASTIYKPVLAGTITLNLKRIESWSLGLLILTLRDLIQGDITLGYGASKGYAACTAAITSLGISGTEKNAMLKELMDKHGIKSEELEKINHNEVPGGKLQIALKECLENLQKKIVEYGKVKGGPHG